MNKDDGNVQIQTQPPKLRAKIRYLLDICFMCGKKHFQLKWLSANVLLMYILSGSGAKYIIPSVVHVKYVSIYLVVATFSHSYSPSSILLTWTFKYSYFQNTIFFANSFLWKDPGNSNGWRDNGCYVTNIVYYSDSHTQWLVLMKELKTTRICDYKMTMKTVNSTLAACLTFSDLPWFYRKKWPWK